MIASTSFMLPLCGRAHLKSTMQIWLCQFRFASGQADQGSRNNKASRRSQHVAK
jgi:hypothetical protein